MTAHRGSTIARIEGAHPHASRAERFRQLRFCIAPGARCTRPTAPPRPARVTCGQTPSPATRPNGRSPSPMQCPITPAPRSGAGAHHTPWPGRHAQSPEAWPTPAPAKPNAGAGTGTGTGASGDDRHPPASADAGTHPARPKAGAGAAVWRPAHCHCRGAGRIAFFPVAGSRSHTRDTSPTGVWGG